MLEFAHALPGLRERAAEHLNDDGLTRERVLACATRLLDRGFFRMGTEGYAEQNQTYGLATIQKRHVRLDGDLITFDYVAKSGRRRLASVLDPAVSEVVAQLKRRRGGGPDLLAYKRGRAWVDVRSDDINAYIKEQTGGDFTAKDFRTWSATVLASVALASSFAQARSKTARVRAISRAVKEVAHYLGNTPAVCRASYIDPRVFDRYRSGLTVAGALEQLGQVDELGEPAYQGPIEEAVLDLIEEKHGPAPELDLTIAQRAG
jgi:DNA topoisomerase IB